MNYNKSLKVINIYNMINGTYKDADFYLTKGERTFHRLRRALTDAHQQGKKYLVCSRCYGALFLRGGNESVGSHRRHFAHYESEEYSKCPLNDGSSSISPEEIKREQYLGLQESRRHKILKNLLGEIIKLDKDCLYSDTAIDKCYSRREKHERRRPDVQTVYKGMNLVFEIQLSKEFITIINERENYYRSKHAYMIWIFDSLSCGDMMTQSQKDIFYSNNSQMFYIDRGTIDKSIKMKKLCLNVIYNIPFVDENMIKNKTECCEITIDDLTFDRNSFLVYYYQYDIKYQELRRKIIINKLKEMLKSSDEEKICSYLHDVTEINDFQFKVYRFLELMLSAKIGGDILGRGVSYYISNCQTLLHDKGNPSWFLYFYSILKNNGHNFLQGNGKKTMICKVKEIFKFLKKNKNDNRCRYYYPDKKFEKLFAFLFPYEYNQYIILIHWIGIPWEKIVISQFDRCDRY